MTGTNKSHSYPITAVPEEIFWYYSRLLQEYNVDPLSSVTVNMCVQNDLEHGLELLTDVKDEDEQTTIPLSVLALHDPISEETAYLYLDEKIKRVRVRQQQLAVLRLIQKQFQTCNFFVPISLIITSILFITNEGVRKLILGKQLVRREIQSYTLSKDGTIGEAALVQRSEDRRWLNLTKSSKQLPAPTVVTFDPREADKAQLHFAK